LSSEAPGNIDRKTDNGGNRNSVDEHVAVCDGSEVSGFRDNRERDRFFEGWNDRRAMIDKIVFDVLKGGIFDLTEDRFDHLFFSRTRKSSIAVLMEGTSRVGRVD
jgi:hypothetical protein